MALASTRTGCKWQLRVHPFGIGAGVGHSVSASLQITHDPPPTYAKSRGCAVYAYTIKVVSSDPEKTVLIDGEHILEWDSTRGPIANKDGRKDLITDIRIDKIAPRQELKDTSRGFLSDDALTILVRIEEWDAKLRPPKAVATVDLSLGSLVKAPQLWAAADLETESDQEALHYADPGCLLAALEQLPLFAPHDFAIVVEGETLHVHLDLLATRSSFFGSPALAHMREGQERVLRLEEGTHGQPVTAATARSALRFMYAGACPAVPVDELRPLLALACYWGVRGLPSLCVEAIRSTLSPKDFIETLAWAHEQASAGAGGPEGEEGAWPRLESHCVQYAAQRMQKVGLGSVAAAALRGGENGTYARLFSLLPASTMARVLLQAVAVRAPAADSVAAVRAWLRARGEGEDPDGVASVLQAVPWAQVSWEEYPGLLRDPLFRPHACLDRLLAAAQYARLVPAGPDGKRPEPGPTVLAESERAWKRIRTGA